MLSRLPGRIRGRQRLLQSWTESRDRPRRRNHADDGRSVGGFFSFAHMERIYVEKKWDRERSIVGTRWGMLLKEGKRREGCRGRGCARRQMHSLALRLKMLALIHGQAASSATEAVALRAELAGVADFAIQLVLMLGAVCRVERFIAKTCNTHGRCTSLNFARIDARYECYLNTYIKSFKIVTALSKDIEELLVENICESITYIAYLFI